MGSNAPDSPVQGQDVCAARSILGGHCLGVGRECCPGSIQSRRVTVRARHEHLGCALNYGTISRQKREVA